MYLDYKLNREIHVSLDVHIPLQRSNEVREMFTGAAYDVHAAVATMVAKMCPQAKLPPACSWRLSEDGDITKSSEVRAQP